LTWRFRNRSESIYVRGVFLRADFSRETPDRSRRITIVGVDISFGEVVKDGKHRIVALIDAGDGGGVYLSPERAPDDIRAHWPNDDPRLEAGDAAD